MKSRHVLIMGVTTLLCVTPIAQAGVSQPWDVEVNFEEGYASGDLQSARWDFHDNVFIGCNAQTHILSDDFRFDYGYCQAEDSNGDFVFCSTHDSDLVGRMSALNDTSWISFYFHGNEKDGYTCTSVKSSTTSFYLR